MYGTDTSQAAALAATGLAVGWHFLATGVLILAGLTMLTIVMVVRHRVMKARITRQADLTHTDNRR